MHVLIGIPNAAPRGTKAHIANLWNGDAATIDEMVNVSVTTVGEEVVITVDAPLHDDPVIHPSPNHSRHSPSHHIYP